MIEIIPAIDILEGKCVRLTQGDYRLRKVYDKDPLDVAKSYEQAGVSRLHMVDLDGAREGRVINWKIAEQVALKTELTLDFGGGIKGTEDLRIVFDSGASMAVIGSVAVKDRDLFLQWLGTYGSERIILGADVKDKMIAVSAWEEVTSLDLLPFLSAYQKAGVSQVLCTDISRDGMLTGPSLELYSEMTEALPDMKIIASGGISSARDIFALDNAGIPAVIIGKALYEGRIKLVELKQFL